MNYLLHHHVAAEALSSNVSGIGAMLPDLWRMSDRRARVRSDQDEPQSNLSGALERGVHHHIAADRWFHSSPAFRRALDETATLLQQTKVVASKSRLLGHIMWELALDGALVEREGAQSIADRISSGFLGCAEGELERVTLLLALARIPEAKDRSEVLGRLKSLISRLFAPSTIAELAEPPGLTKRLRGVRRRLGLDDLPAAEREGANRVFGALLETASDRIEALLRFEWSGLLLESPPRSRARS